ncbi:MAG: AraC family transcriptional regulator [Clostridia bacterium]|nr:AraC family transcriptional regulator [Clostridia bacterium]
MLIDEPGVLPNSEIHIFNPSNPALSALIHIPFWGEYHCAPPYTIEREQYDALLLFSVHSGQLELAYEGQTTLLTSGRVQLIDCRKPQLYRALGDVRFDWIHFKGGSSQVLYDCLAEHKATGFIALDQPELANEVSRLKQQLTMSPDDDWAINLALTRLLTVMIETAAGNVPLEHSLVTQAHVYMTEHFREDLHLSDIARQFNVSLCHFARQFRRHYKVSPHEYLINLRISEARRHLLLTGESVEQIASVCGFHSTSHFIRSFGQRTGVTPAQFRKLKF